MYDYNEYDHRSLSMDSAIYSNKLNIAETDKFGNENW